MAKKKPNKARDVPQVNYGADDPEDNRAPEYPVVYSFPTTHPIFWGPSQDTQYVDGTEGYTPPSPAAFNGLIALTIPVVIRGITGYNTAYSPPPVPPVPPTGPGHCEVGDSGTIVIGYQQGQDGVYAYGRSSAHGTIIPGYYDSDTGYPDGIPCSGGFPQFFTYMKAFVIQNDIAENYGPFNDIHGVPQTTEDIMANYVRLPEHNKGSWQGYTSRAYAEISVRSEQIVNIGGGPAPGLYATGCYSQGLGTAPFALSSGEILPMPSGGYPAGEGPSPPDGGRVVYYLNSGGETKFTIFWILSCYDMSQGRLVPTPILVGGWSAALPPPPITQYMRDGVPPGRPITLGPLEPGD